MIPIIPQKIQVSTGGTVPAGTRNEYFMNPKVSTKELTTLIGFTPNSICKSPNAGKYLAFRTTSSTPYIQVVEIDIENWTSTSISVSGALDAEGYNNFKVVLLSSNQIAIFNPVNDTTNHRLYLGSLSGTTLTVVLETALNSQMPAGNYDDQLMAGNTDDDKVYFMDVASGTFKSYDFSSNAWATLSSGMPAPYSSYRSAYYNSLFKTDDYVYFVVNANNSSSNNMELWEYDIGGNSWKQIGSDFTAYANRYTLAIFDPVDKTKFYLFTYDDESYVVDVAAETMTVMDEVFPWLNSGAESGGCRELPFHDEANDITYVPYGGGNELLSFYNYQDIQEPQISITGAGTFHGFNEPLSLQYSQGNEYINNPFSKAEYRIDGGAWKKVIPPQNNIDPDTQFLNIPFATSLEIKQPFYEYTAITGTPRDDEDKIWWNPNVGIVGSSVSRQALFRQKAVVYLTS